MMVAQNLTQVHKQRNKRGRRVKSNALVEIILWKQCIARRRTTMNMLRDTPFERFHGI